MVFHFIQACFMMAILLLNVQVVICNLNFAFKSIILIFIKNINFSIPDKIQWIFIVIILAVSIMFIFPPSFLLMYKFSDYAIHWMLLCLLIGIVSLFIGNEKFLYSCFISTGILAFFLMNSFNTDLRLTKLNNPASISLLFVNLTFTNDAIDHSLQSIYGLDPDILVLEELSPDNIEKLQSTRSRYPYQTMLPRIDPLGKAVLSKFPFYEESSFGIFGNPILNLGLKNQLNDSFKILVSNSLPIETSNSFSKMNQFLDSLCSKIKKDFPNVILTANFNLVPWSRELRNFRIKTGLMASRRDNNEGISNAKTLSIFNTPNNEIFYSRSLECSYFKVLLDSEGNELGLYGRYQKRVPF